MRKIKAQKVRKSSRSRPQSSKTNPRLTSKMARLVANTISANAGRSEDPDKPVAAERWFTVNGRVSVYQTPAESPRFIILSNYPDLAQVLSDLGIPADRLAIYYSCFLKGGDYAKATGAAYYKSQLFTVELFGRFLHSGCGGAFERNSPKWLQPKFWSDSTGEEIAIWRTRVYSQPLAWLRLAPSRPMSPYSPCFPYLEERWNPVRDRNALLLGGLEGFSGGFPLLNKFYQRASSILKGAPAKWGRTPIDPIEFYKSVVRVHEKLWIRNKEKPGMKQVAKEMDLNLNTFKSRWRKTLMSWDDIPRPSELANET